MGHRQLVVSRAEGPLDEVLAVLGGTEVCWVASELVGGPVPAGCVAISGREIGRWLGRAFDVVVVDARSGIDADVLGQVHGMVRGGGALVVWLGAGSRDVARQRRLAVVPYSVEDVGRRFGGRVEQVLRERASQARPVATGAFVTRASREQAALVAELIGRWKRAGGSWTAILADRGRGKSSALGLALREVGDAGLGSLVVTAGSEHAVAEVLRFAGERVAFVPALELLGSASTPRVIVVDEAATLPVPLLQRLVQRHAGAHFAFATTTHGYEGTGRGFSLRFLAWLEDRGELVRRELHEPIRWAADDPLERAVFDALLLDAEPARVEIDDLEGAVIECARIDRDELAGDLPRLRELFGLLVHAHYRTTPSDLERILDAPNLQVHVGRLGEQIVAATVIAEEGALPAWLCAEAHAGRTRLRAHALADALVVHLGQVDAGGLRMRRSVRTAVHPQLRRRGIAAGLVEHVHRSALAEASGEDGIDLVGTLFGATPQLVKFRRSVGYELVRVSASRGARSGEPAVVMIRAASAAGERLVARLRRELARELEVQLELLAADDGLSLEAEMIEALREGLPAAAPYTAVEQRAAARDYAHGPRTFESMATALRGYLETVDLTVLPAPLGAVVEGRALRLLGWREVTGHAGMDSVPATMRALRRAFRLLVARDREVGV